MPRVMEKNDWMRTVANVASADRVWSENVVGSEGTVSFAIPESGIYQIILVKLGESGKRPETRTRPTRQRKGKTPSLFEALRSCPFGGVELEIERDHGAGRTVEWA